ncbi:hypothetical protein C7123_06250 [Tannerella serpentiformis]|jgi:hypothetical protein|uniref:TMEM43 family protein n=1 Tax=Tannerella serpentiformis TaxID=712710 RepID=UPI000840DBC2|nr:TMEM43 family protein [Tannerella serpentiformis]AOH41640.1 hypothetical protein BCB71_11240 [Tannerella serpentiformis]AVV53357.1 hypothetical protein C7123_06250 [Tannerella serpentiformis]
MAYTETTSTSYGQRLAGSAKGMIGGLMMFIIGTCLLWWNEGRTVRTAKAIGDAASHVESVADVSRVDASLNGKLIHASAFADTKDTLTDDLFGVREQAIKLDRKVEYYQWVEHSQRKKRDKVGGGEETITTYTYEQEWVKKPVNSSNFKESRYRNANRVLSEVEERNEMAQHVTFGAYTLPESFVASISGSEPVEVRMTEEQRFTWNERLHMLRPKVNTETSLVHTSANTVYLGLSPNSPQVGDVRVTFTKVPPADISLIAQVDGSTFKAYRAKNGQSFSRLQMGTVSADEMIEQARSENNMLTWVLRLVGVLLIVIGLKGMFGLLPMLFKVLPFLGSIVDAGVGLVSWILGLAWSFIIIAIAWLVFRPIIGISLLVLAIAGIVFLKRRGKKNEEKQPA